jgi:hypothetical protein
VFITPVSIWRVWLFFPVHRYVSGVCILVLAEVWTSSVVFSRYGWAVLYASCVCIGITFRSTNTTQKLMKPIPKKHIHEHEKSGVYKLICNTRKLAYIGQTSRSLKLRYQEHTRYIRHNNPQSAYTHHILQNHHEYGPITNTMKLLKPEQKASMLIPYEQLYIQIYHQKGHLIPEQSSGDYNPLFQLITNMLPMTDTNG